MSEPIKFATIAELVALANAVECTIGEIMLRYETETSLLPRETIYQRMALSLQVMKEGIDKGRAGVRSHSGLSGGDARTISQTSLADNLLGEVALECAASAIAMGEVNASMGRICATPTAGACGVVPGALLAAAKKRGADERALVGALFAAGAFGLVIANNASISGAAGGCQAEIGSASGMAAAAVVQLCGGTPEQSANAAALALKNLLGLTCDPVAGLVEVPCVKRNGFAAVHALLAADLALSGVVSRIPCDEVIWAMRQTGQLMPTALRETSLAGLAATPTGRQWEEKVLV